MTKAFSVLQKLNIELPSDSVISLLGVNPKELKARVQTFIDSLCFLHVLINSYYFLRSLHFCLLLLLIAKVDFHFEFILKENQLFSPFQKNCPLFAKDR